MPVLTFPYPGRFTVAPVAIRQMRNGRGIVVTGDHRATATSTISDPGATPRANQAAHILVVDDNPGLRKLLRDCLSESGHTVATAEDGQAALAVIAERPPDLVISDIEMPRLSGVELRQVLHVQHPSIPILLVSAHDPADFPDVPVLAKPFRLVQLLDTVQTLLAER